ncbi:MAG: DUF4167 domain-containing protein [Sphingomonas sp.]
MINNRQAGRRRGRGGQQQRSQGNPGRPDNGNRIDNRARGNAAQLLEKYKSLAADAQRSGDRVNTEYYLQFADHYFRVLAETRSRFEENRQANGGPAYQEDEQEYDEDGEPIAPRERQQSQPQPQHHAGQQGRQDYQPRQDQAEGGRDDRPRRSSSNNGNGNGSYDQQGERQQRGPRPERGGQDRGARQDFDRDPQPQHGSVERFVAEGPLGVEGEPIAEQPRRRGRPRREDSAAPSGFDAGILPPALGVSAKSDEDMAVPAEKPRRRRARVEASETPPAE